jgi:hypothetical protein
MVHGLRWSSVPGFVIYFRFTMIIDLYLDYDGSLFPVDDAHLFPVYDDHLFPFFYGYLMWFTCFESQNCRISVT